jgi:hypothetical protein
MADFVDILAPSLAIALNLEYRCLPVLGIIVNAGKVITFQLKI